MVSFGFYRHFDRVYRLESPIEYYHNISEQYWPLSPGILPASLSGFPSCGARRGIASPPCCSSAGAPSTCRLWGHRVQTGDDVDMGLARRATHSNHPSPSGTQEARYTAAHTQHVPVTVPWYAAHLMARDHVIHVASWAHTVRLLPVTCRKEDALEPFGFPSHIFKA